MTRGGMRKAVQRVQRFGWTVASVRVVRGRYYPTVVSPDGYDFVMGCLDDFTAVRENLLTPER